MNTGCRPGPRSGSWHSQHLAVGLRGWCPDTGVTPRTEECPADAWNQLDSSCKTHHFSSAERKMIHQCKKTPSPISLLSIFWALPRRKLSAQHPCQAGPHCAPRSCSHKETPVALLLHYPLSPQINTGQDSFAQGKGAFAATLLWNFSIMTGILGNTKDPHEKKMQVIVTVVK